MKKVVYLEIILLFVIVLFIAVNEKIAFLLYTVLAFEVYKDFFSKKVDEFEKLLRYKTANMAFYAIIGLTILFLGFKISLSENFYYFYILFPLLLKNLLYIGYIFNRKKVIKRTGYSIVILLLLFTVLSHGFSFEGFIESLPWIYLLISTAVAIKFRIVGSILFLFAFFVVTYFIFRGNLNSVKILMYSLIGTPLLFLSIQSLRRE